MRVPFKLGSPKQWAILTCIAVGYYAMFVWLPVDGSTPDDANLSKCRSNLKQIGIAFQVYRQENGGWLPPFDSTSSALEILHANALAANSDHKDGPMNIDNAIYICPGRNSDGDVEHGRIDYDCWRGGSLSTDVLIRIAGRLPIAWDGSANHNGLTNILFADGHVECWGIIELEKSLDQAQSRWSLNR